MSEMDGLDRKLNEAFDGKVLRKDLLHRIKEGYQRSDVRPGVSAREVLRQQ